MFTVSGRKMFLLISMSSIAILTIACGGGDDGDSPTATSAPSEPTATQAATDPTDTPADGGDAASGEESFVSAGCSACHSTGTDRVVGPGLAGVADRAAALGGDEYLYESIVNPNAVVVEDYPPVMTAFTHLDDQTVADLVAYLNTLD